MTKKICFVSLNIYPLLQKKSAYEFMGGAELQQVILANSLKKAGYEVSFVTCVWDGKKEEEHLSGMGVFKAYDGAKGIPLLRFLYPRGFKIWRAMKRANADVYYQRGASSLTGIVALFCKIKKRTFLFSGAHDGNFLIKKFQIYKIQGLIAHINWKIYLHGLRNTCHVFVQSVKQKDLLFENYNIKGTVFHNLYPSKSTTNDFKYVLWVGTIKKIKRPFLFLEIAERMPGYRFVMVGGSSIKNPEYFQEVSKKAKKIKNLEFMGFQSFERTEKYFDNASVFINTSEMEGFPNTFLQAWSRGIPTISFLDVDDIVRNNELGAIVSSLEEMEVQIAKLMQLSTEERAKIQNYFLERHSEEKNGERFIDLIDEILKQRSPPVRESFNA